MSSPVSSSTMAATGSGSIFGQYLCPFLSKARPASQPSLIPRRRGRPTGSKKASCPLGVEKCPFGGHIKDYPVRMTRSRASIGPAPTEDIATSSTTLHKLPTSICAHNLVQKCDEVVEILEKHNLYRCSFGFHITTAELSDLGQFYDRVASYARQQLTCSNQKNPKCKESTRKRPRSTSPGDCAICLQKLVAPYGIQVDCQHIFHSACLIRWYQSTRSSSFITNGSDPLALLNRCPTCRTRSSYIMMYPTVPSPEEKRKLFAIQKNLVEVCGNLIDIH